MVIVTDDEDCFGGLGVGLETYLSDVFVCSFLLGFFLEISSEDITPIGLFEYVSYMLDTWVWQSYEYDSEYLLMGCNTFYHTALCLSNKVDKGSRRVMERYILRLVDDDG